MNVQTVLLVHKLFIINLCEWSTSAMAHCTSFCGVSTSAMAHCTSFCGCQYKCYGSLYIILWVSVQVLWLTVHHSVVSVQVLWLTVHHSVVSVCSLFQV